MLSTCCTCACVQVLDIASLTLFLMAMDCQVSNKSSLVASGMALIQCSLHLRSTDPAAACAAHACCTFPQYFAVPPEATFTNQEFAGVGGCGLSFELCAPPAYLHPPES
jgi:hypothetical protein